VFWIVSSYPTFLGEHYDTLADAHERMRKIAVMDPPGFLAGAYWIVFESDAD
jgi:hypothetical protein